MEQFHDIYDRVAKRCLSLSSKSTIHVINGLYDTKYPDDSEINYHWTEFEDDDLRRTLADTIITVNRSFSYHIEIQMTNDGSIIWRMFDYGYHAAVQNPNGTGILYFPEPKIIYLYEHEKAPDFYEMTIEFGGQGSFLYRVSTFKYLDQSMEELNRRKLIVLIPFQLLKLRKAIEKERTSENLLALKNLITCDIIGAITENENAGNITRSEARKLKRMTLQLYHHIYDKYGEMEEAGVNDVVEEALILDIDIIEHEHKKELKAKEQEVEALVLDIDIIEQEHKKELKAKEQEVEALVLDIDIIEQEHKKELKAKEQEVEALVLDIDIIEQEHKKELKAKEQEVEALVLDIDIIEQEHKKELKAKEQEVEALVLDIDIIEQEHKKELKAKEQEVEALKLLIKGTPDEEILTRTGITQEKLQELKM